MPVPDTIVIVDDTEGTRFALRRMLERAGFSVLEGACGADALRLADAEPSLMIIDVHMPDLMGTEVSRRIKADPRTRGIPILQLSASFTGELDRATGLECGADAYLTEPVDPQLLLATIHALLRSRSAERAAARALESQDAFLSITSHDIRNLLHGMQMTLATQLRKAQERHVDQQGLAQTLQRSIDDVTRMTRLVDDLLDGAQLKAGKLALRREEMDLSVAVRGIVERWKSQSAARANVVVEAADEVRGSFDLLRLNQILVNLLSNALKYGGDKPIAVRVRREEDRAVIEVADEGPGVPDADSERIFERFDRGAASERMGSYGLGLWIVRELARLHGGTASLVTGQGRGAVFRVILPLPVAAAA